MFNLSTVVITQMLEVTIAQGADFRPEGRGFDSHSIELLNLRDNNANAILMDIYYYFMYFVGLWFFKCLLFKFWVQFSGFEIFSVIPRSLELWDRRLK